MAAAVVQWPLGLMGRTGDTISLFALSAIDPAAAASGIVLTEGVNQTGSYSGTTNAALTGVYRAWLINSAGTKIAIGYVLMSDDTSIHLVIEDVPEARVNTGPISISIRVLDDNGDPLISAIVWLIFNTNTYHAITDSNGIAILSPYDGANTYNVRINAGSRLHFSPVDLVVTEDIAVTYSMITETLTPSTNGKVTGYLYAEDGEGNYISNITHYLQLIEAPRGDVGRSFTTPIRTAISNNVGLVQFTNITPDCTYEVWINSSKKSSFIVPKTSFRIATCKS